MAKRSKVKARPRRKATAPKPTTSTALVFSAPQIAKVRQELVERVAASARTELVSPSGVLGEDAVIGPVGTFDIRLTPEEEKVLDEPINEDTVAIKPTGEPYLPWEVYARWFSRAFGRLGWALVPASRPRVGDNAVVVPYVLHIHGKPAAFAWGEQEYFAGNKRQSIGDAIESTVASGMRRVAKRLGVGLELWRKSWLEDFIQRRAMPVVVKERDREVTRWRLTNQRPLPGEVHPADRSRASRGSWTPDDADEAPPPRQTTQARDEGGHRVPAGHDGRSGDAISEKQLKRLWAIASGAQRDRNDVTAWITSTFGVSHPRELARKDYDYACECLEAPGALPRGGRG